MADVRINGITTLRAAAAALKTVDRQVRSTVKRYLSDNASDIWESEDRSVRAPNVKGASMLETTSSSARATAYGVKFSATPRAETKGLDYAMWEFGDPRKTVERTSAPVYGRKPKQAYKRRTQEQLPGASSGRRYTQIKRRVIPRAASLITQTVIKTINEALEGK